MKTALLTVEDMNQINQTISPRIRKASCTFGFIAICLCFLLPFMPGKLNHFSPYQEGTYWHGFLFYFVVSCLMALLSYYRFVMSINQDIKDGEKIVARLPVKIKNSPMLGSNFELLFDKGRLLHTPKITLPKTEFDNWQEGDLVDFDLLYKSGEILNYKKVYSKAL